MATSQQFSTNVNLSAIPEIDQKKYPELYTDSIRIRNAIRVLQDAIDQNTGAIQQNPDIWAEVKSQNTVKFQNLGRVYVIASEAIAVGQIVELYNNAGTLNARLAGTVGPKKARAFCSTIDGVSIGAYGEFMLLGVNQFFTGLTPGATYYLAAAGGLIQAVVSAQPVGFALSSQNLFFNPTLI